MAKQQKSKNSSARKTRRPEKELLKKPFGMCSKIFKEIASTLAEDIKIRRKSFDLYKKKA